MRLIHQYFIFLWIPFGILAGNGDPLEGYDGYPLWYERASMVLTNACRMGPTDYRDKFLGSYDILLPTNYPPVTPVYWNIDLNRAARDHSLDQATNCGMQHSSCDGTSAGDRIRSYYTKGYGWGENIAYFNYRPQSTVEQWLMDADRNGIPAPDNQVPDTRWYSGDGHRSNIMSPDWEEIGVGYAEGTSEGELYPFWTQDFGGGKNEWNDHYIPCGSHVFINSDAGWGTDEIEADSVTFMANFYNTENTAPARAHVYINGNGYDLHLAMGQVGQGTYILALPKQTVCREYYFEFEDDKNVLWRYPEEGFLHTYGEGSCTGDYSTGSNLFVSHQPLYGNKLNLIYDPHTRGIQLSIDAVEMKRLQKISLYTITGNLLHVWASPTEGLDSGKYLLPITSDMERGVYIIRLNLNDGDVWQERVPITR
ncbi:MAG: CAP domain-containing protein [Fibrobacteria bacterium]|nr:CAP domain-containing protein [Fibrobacteria bacterium]